MDSFDRAIILAALGEYAAAHPELVAQVDQAEAAVLAEWQPGGGNVAPRHRSVGDC